MNKVLMLFGTFTISISAFSQDRGCPGSTESFEVITEDSTYTVFYHEGRRCWVMGQYELDTATIQLPFQTEFEIKWSARDNDYYAFYSKVDWYRNDVEVSDSKFSFEIDYTGGNCYNHTGNLSVLNSSQSGVYQFKCNYDQYSSSFIKIEFLEPIVVDSIPVVLNYPLIEIFPNPANSILSIHHGKIEAGEVNVFDIQGRLLYSKTLNSVSDQSRLNLQSFSTGSYLVRLQTDVHGIITKKLIIEK